MAVEEIVEGAKRLLLTRKQSYVFLFEPDNKANLNSQAVLKDLAEFCRADKTTFHADPRVHAVLEGRREVWLRIQKYLNLSPDELWDLTRKE